MRFSQVDVFSSEPLRGNALAVVHDADAVSDDEMAAFARWTNLSETTFLLAPTSPDADYRVRIWTPGGELPFAGHPTLGSCHAWLEAGGVPASSEHVVQECGAGLVRVRRDGDRLAFAAPPLTRTGPVSEDDVAAICRALRITDDEVLESEWIDNGPGWVGVRLADADAVLALDPDWAAFGDLKVGVVGEYAAGPVAVEVRAFCPGYGMPEDPVTGSLNAGIGQWLAGTRLPTAYVASQGTALQRAGRVHVSLEDGTVWVGGETRTTIAGTVTP
ncbi:PhzF family phenazine biosynthesis protein [Nocardioides ginsengisegetis]|uniref:PhzF family phenazine biosynthesis protein n=1 Tax=Nocardioides ginsengisegetis TaxID=661491 RepID=A0A7W3IYD7_9ACTN|nr:PhzF family phenazine biosynthesis protein [Nocardioides ginsengisegetis]MBA8802930.1 PhzF family phenazine biosynthesis protein [Nocardioides ginsengisegetis]